MKETIALTREDLRRDKEDVSINDITLYDIKSNVMTREEINRANFIVFVNNDNKIKVLKKRYKNERYE